MDLSLILTSTVVAGVVSAIFTLYSKSRENSLKHITEERKAWRDKIRELADELFAACILKAPADFEHAKWAIYTKLAVRLNPKDDYDNEILSALKVLKAGDVTGLEGVLVGMSNLLKHDWDRAKNEVSSFKKALNYFLFISSILLAFLKTNDCASFGLMQCPVWCQSITTLLLLATCIPFFLWIIKIIIVSAIESRQNKASNGKRLLSIIQKIFSALSGYVFRSTTTVSPGPKP